MSKIEYKYTKDRKKVVVLGKLNSQEFIVQEIYMHGDQEVPAGESFVAKGLLDQPMETWQERVLRKIKERFEQDKKAEEREGRKIVARLQEYRQKAALRASALLGFAKYAEESQLRTLHDFLAGEITHFFIDDYRPRIVTWDDKDLYQFTDSWGGRKGTVEAIKLVSLWGASDGSLDYRISSYSDGSGSSSRIVPCRSYDEALAAAQERLDRDASQYLSGKRASLNVEQWQKVDGIIIPPDALARWEYNKEKARQSAIQKLRADLEKLEGRERAKGELE